MVEFPVIMIYMCFVVFSLIGNVLRSARSHTERHSQRCQRPRWRLCLLIFGHHLNLLSLTDTFTIYLLFAPLTTTLLTIIITVLFSRL